MNEGAPPRWMAFTSFTSCHLLLETWLAQLRRLAGSNATCPSTLFSRWQYPASVHQLYSDAPLLQKILLRFFSSTKQVGCPVSNTIDPIVLYWDQCPLWTHRHPSTLEGSWAASNTRRSVSWAHPPSPRPELDPSCRSSMHSKCSQSDWDREAPQTLYSSETSHSSS